MSGTAATPTSTEPSEAERAQDDYISNRPDETAGIDDNSIPGEDAIPLNEGVGANTFHGGRSILTEAQIRALGAPYIQASRVKELEGNSYLQAWDVKATLLKVFGWGGFSTEVLKAEIIAIREHAAGTLGHVERFDRKSNGRQIKAGDPKTPQVIAQVTMRLTLHNIGPSGQDVVHTETAVGLNSQWDIGEACDTAIKSAESDALKRCAIFLGTQFGLSLYNAGDFTDVVRRVLVPWQGKVLDDARQASAAAGAAQARADLARATGAQS